MSASVCLEQKRTQQSLQKTSKGIWGFTCQIPFVSEFLFQRRGWHVCKHPCSAPSTSLSASVGSRSSCLLRGRDLGHGLGVLLWEGERCPSGACQCALWLSFLVSFYQHTRLTQCPQPLPQSRAAGGSGWDPHPVPQLPREAFSQALLSSSSLSPFPVFTFLIWFVCLAPPWLAHGKLVHFGNPWPGEISFLESGSRPPLPASTPQQAAGRGLTCAPCTRTPLGPRTIPAPSPALPPRSHCSLLPCRFPPPCKLLGFFPAYLFSLREVHRLEKEWALVKQKQTCHPQQLCKARFLLAPREKRFHCFLS